MATAVITSTKRILQLLLVRAVTEEEASLPDQLAATQCAAGSSTRSVTLNRVYSDDPEVHAGGRGLHRAFKSEDKLLRTGA